MLVFPLLTDKPVSECRALSGRESCGGIQQDEHASSLNRLTPFSTCARTVSSAACMKWQVIRWQGTTRAEEGVVTSGDNVMSLRSNIRDVKAGLHRSW